jgi:hypothetical protein
MPPEPHAATEAAFNAALWQDTLPPGLAAPDPSEIARRFSVYRNNVSHGLTRALAARFPVVEQLVGVEFFTAMARIFIADAPPEHPVLLRWGAALPAFLETFPPVGHLPWLADVARLELTRGRAYHAADAAPVAPEALAVADPERLRLTLHPSVALFASPHPAVRIWEAHQPGAVPGAPVGPGPDHALVARQPDFAVIVARVDPATLRVIARISAGLPLGEAADEDDPTAALTLLLRHGLITAIATGDAP